MPVPGRPAEREVREIERRSDNVRRVAAARLRPPRARGIVRPRLQRALATPWDDRLTIVTGAPGTGKTVMVAHAVAGRSEPVAWYRAGPDSADPATLMAHLQTAMAAGLANPDEEWATVDDALGALEAVEPGRMLLVVDDLHHLDGTVGGRWFENLILDLPTAIAVVATARWGPGRAMARLHAAGCAREIEPDELRFRSWEAQRLAAEVHGEALNAAEADLLVRSTGGWAVAVALTLSAVAGRAAHRHRAIADPPGATPALAEYLDSELIGWLPEADQAALVASAAYDRLPVALAEELLGEGGPRANVRLLFDAEPGDGSLRHHRLLLPRLRRRLEPVAHREAATVLEHAGLVTEAIAAYARAGDHDAVTRLLSVHGSAVLASPWDWAGGEFGATGLAHPAALVARARHHLAAGEIEPALVAYATAAGGRAGPEAETARREAAGLLALIGDEPPKRPDTATDWPQLLRSAAEGSPDRYLAVAAGMAGPTGRLVEGVIRALAGHLEAARAALAEAAADTGAAPVVPALARLLEALVASGFQADTSPHGLEAAAGQLEAVPVPWAAAAARLALVAAGKAGLGRVGDVTAFVHDRDRVGDRWGGLLGSLFGGVGVLARCGSAAEARSAASFLESAVDRSRELGAGTLEAWARAALAVAHGRAGLAEADETARTAQAVARDAGVPVAAGIAFAALAALDGPNGHDARNQAEALAAQSGDGARLIGGVVAAARASAPPSPDEELVLVGRDREMASLLSRFEGAATGASQVVRIVGEPGIGKTTVLRRLASEARQRGGDIRSTQGSPGAPPYSAWARLVDELIERRDAQELTRALGPASADILALASGTAWQRHDAAGRRARLAASIIRLLAWKGRDRPLILLIDDVHHLDLESLALLRTVAQTMGPARVLIVIAYDDELLGPAAAELLDGRLPSTTVRLGGLTDNDLRSLARTGLLGREPTPDLLLALGRVTGGNPALVAEAVRLLPADTSSAVAVPEAARALVERRLAQLGPEAVGVLSIAAALGDMVETELVAAAAGATEISVQAALGRAAAARLIEAADRGVWRFRPPGVAEILRERLAAGAAAAAHRRAADLLEARIGTSRAPDPAVVAGHLLNADVVPGARVARWVGLAVTDAVAGGRAHMGQALCERALTVVGDDLAVRGELLHSLGVVRRHTSGERAAREAFGAAADAARATGDVDLLARAALGYSQTIGDTGFPDEALVGLLEQAAERLPVTDTPLRAAVEARLAAALDSRPASAERGRSLSTLACDRAYRVGDPQAIAMALAAWHWTLWGPDKLAARLDAAAEMARHAEESGDAELVLAARCYRHHDLLELGDVAAADVEQAAYTRLATKEMRPGSTWRLGIMRVARALLEGRFMEAASIAADARTALRTGSAPMAEEYFSMQLLVRSRDLGRLTAVEGSLRRVSELRPDLGLWRAARVYMQAELGRGAEARIGLERFVVDDLQSLPEDLHWLPTVALLGEAACRLGHEEAAATLYRRLLPWSGLVVVMGVGAAVLGAVAGHLGRLATTMNRLDEAAVHFEDALSAEMRLGSGPLLARTRLAYGQALLRRDESQAESQGRALIVDAVDTARGYGMQSLVSEGTAVLESGPPARKTVGRLPVRRSVDVTEPGGGAGAPADGAAVAAAAPPSPPVTRSSVIPPIPAVRLRCFGGCRLELRGRRVDLAAMKPRVRSVLWVLAAHAGQPVHAERLIDALWPDATLDAGRRNLQVAISSLRQALEPGVRRGPWERVAREGDSYRLVLGDDGECDVVTFEVAVADARAYRAAGRSPEAMAAFDRALGVYRGELIPEAGPADWILPRRDALRLEAVDAAGTLAELRLAVGEVAAALGACDRGLLIDRYQDRLWRLTIDAHHRNRDLAAEEKARRAYDEVLADLGVTGT